MVPHTEDHESELRPFPLPYYQIGNNSPTWGLEGDTQVIQSDPCSGDGDTQWQETPQNDTSTSSAKDMIPNVPQEK